MSRPDHALVQYWDLLLKNGYKKHSLIEPAVGIDAIVIAVLNEKYSLGAENSLTAQLIEGIMALERDIIEFLNKVDACPR